MFRENDPILPAQYCKLPEEQTPRKRHDRRNRRDEESSKRGYIPRGRSFMEYAAAGIAIWICPLQHTGEVAASVPIVRRGELEEFRVRMLRASP